MHKSTRAKNFLFLNSTTATAVHNTDALHEGHGGNNISSLIVKNIIKVTKRVLAKHQLQVLDLWGGGVDAGCITTYQRLL